MLPLDPLFCTNERYVMNKIKIQLLNLRNISNSKILAGHFRMGSWAGLAIICVLTYTREHSRPAKDYGFTL